MIRLYALKCDGGYVKKDSSNGCICVAIEKASVFKEQNLSEVDVLLKNASSSGLTGVRLIELNIIEKENKNAEELKQKLREMLLKSTTAQEKDRKDWENILLEKLRLSGEKEFVALAEKVRDVKNFDDSL